MSERYYGFRVITCESQLGLDVLKTIITSIGEVWNGANIQLRYLADLPRPPKIKIAFPGELEISDILPVLEITNPDLNTKSWSVVNNVEHKNGKTVVIFRADEESLEILSKKDNKISFSLRKIQVEIMDSKVKSAPPNNPVSDKPLEIESLIPEMEGTTLRVDGIDTTSLANSTLVMEVEGGKGNN